MYKRQEEDLTAAGMVKVLGGNMLVIDLRDKLRTPAVMVPSGTDYGIMDLQILGVKDAEGNFAYSDGSGSLGSFFYTFPCLLYTSCNSSSNSIIIIENIHVSKEASMRWKSIVHDARVGRTFDLYYCGIIFMDKEKCKQHYIVNF